MKTFWNPFATYTMACLVVVLVYALGYSSLYPELTMQVSMFLAFSVITAVLFSLLVMRTPLAENDASGAGMSDWLAGNREEPGDWQGLATLAPARSRKSRHGAILLPFRALLAAINAAK